MKKQYKLLAVFVAVVLVVCCCCVPVSAATLKNSNTNSIWSLPSEAVVLSSKPDGTNFSRSDESVNWVRPVHPDYNDNDTTMYCALPSFSNETGDYLLLTYVLHFNLHDTIVSESGDIIKLVSQLSVKSPYISRNSYINKMYVNCHGTDGESSFLFRLFDTGVINSYGGKYSVDTTREIVPSVEIDYFQLYIQVVFYPDATNEGGYYVGWYNDDVTIRYGDRDNVALEIQNDATNEKLGEILAAEQVTQYKLDELTEEQALTNEYLNQITAEKFEPPSGQDQMDEFAGLEAELNNSAQDGLNDVSSLFANFDISSFALGLGGIVTIYNHIIPEIPWLYSLLTVSLSLGLFAFLVGFAQVFIGRLNANDRQAKTSAYRRAMYMKGRRK